MRTLEALDKYLRGHKLAKSTQYHCERAFKFLNEFEQELPMSKAMLNEFAVWLPGKYPQLSDISVRDYCHYIKIVYSYLKDIYEWDKNPAETAMKIAVKQRQRRYFTSEEELHILNSCKTDFQKCLIGTLEDSGCRVHELSSLKVDDVNPTGFKVGKNTKTGERHCRLKPEIAKLMLQIADPNTRYVFHDNKGNPLSPTALRDRTRWVIVELAHMTGSKLGAHTFRHSAASLIAGETGSMLAVQSVTGHKDSRIAQGYIHDAQQKIAQQYSPLDIAMKNTNQNNTSFTQKPLALSPGTDNNNPISTEIIIGENGEVESHKNDLIEEMFKRVPENRNVYPKLSSEDLTIIRHGLQMIVQHSQWINADIKARNLWARMTRKL